MKENNKKAAASSPDSIARHFLFPIAIAIIVFIVYGHTIRFGFVFDDIDNILNNPSVLNFRWSQLLPQFAQPWRAVTQISYGLTYSLFDFNGAAFHLTNILIHVINSILVFAMARLLARKWIAPEEADFFSVTAGLIFAVHPLHSEAVAYIWGRTSSLCALFYFASLLFMLLGLAGSNRRKLLWFGCAIFAGFLAWKTKEEAITLPFVAAALAALMGTWRAAAGLSILPFMLAAFQWRSLSQLRSLLGENAELASGGFAPALAPIPHFLTSLKAAVFYYLKLYIYPIGQSADVGLKPVFSFLDPTLLLAIIILLALILIPFLMRSERMLLFGMTALLVSPLTAYAFIPLADVVSERRIYIAGLGFGILAAWILSRMPRYRSAVLIAIVAVLGFMTMQRVEVWSNSLALWQDAARKSPMLARPHLNLGMAYQASGADDLAMAEYLLALELNPRLAPVYTNIAGIYFNRNDLKQSEDYLKKAMELAPAMPAPYLNLAQIAMKNEKPREALDILNRMPPMAESHLQSLTKGDVYAQLGRYAEAAAEYESVIRQRPDLRETVELARSRIDRLRKLGAIR